MIALKKSSLCHLRLNKTLWNLQRYGPNLGGNQALPLGKRATMRPSDLLLFSVTYGHLEGDSPYFSPPFRVTNQHGHYNLPKKTGIKTSAYHPYMVYFTYMEGWFLWFSCRYMYCMHPMGSIAFVPTTSPVTTSRKLHLDLEHPPLVQSHVRPYLCRFGVSTSNQKKCDTLKLNGHQTREEMFHVFCWLVVEPTPSEKYARQIGSFPQVGVKIKNGWNHHLVSVCVCFSCFLFPLYHKKPQQQRTNITNTLVNVALGIAENSCEVGGSPEFIAQKMMETGHENRTSYLAHILLRIVWRRQLPKGSLVKSP